jgi:glycosyltransferase involved in cell wall biosynthesis
MGGASFSAGQGDNYATPAAFSSKTNAKGTKSIYYYKLGFKPVPKIKPKSYDIKKLWEDETLNEVNSFQKKRLDSLEEIEKLMNSKISNKTDKQLSGFLKARRIKQYSLSGELIAEYHSKSYAEKKLGVKSLELIPYGVDEPLEVSTMELSNFVTDKSLLGRKIIISVGHVNQLRNRLDLVQAIERVAKDEPSILLVVIGDIADKRASELVAKLKISENVLFTGVGTKAEIALWRQLALFEAQWLEQAPDGSNSFGVASMEGMMAGNTVLSVANIDTFGAGTLKNFGNVIVIQPNSDTKLSELILELIRSPSVLDSIGEEAKLYAQENFSWSENAERHIKLYSRLKQ